MVKMTHYIVTGYSFDDDGVIKKKVTVRGFMKDCINFLGVVMRRHPDLCANSEKVELEKWQKTTRFMD